MMSTQGVYFKKRSLSNLQFKDGLCRIPKLEINYDRNYLEQS